MRPKKSKVFEVSEKLGRFQVAHPWRFIAVAAFITALGAAVASGLTFNSGYEVLLPRGAPEIENANSVRDRTGGTRQIVLAISGDDPDKRIAFGRLLTDELQKMEQIRFVDFEFPVDFFKDRGLWLMDISSLDKLVPAVENAVKISKWQANPMHLHLDEEEEKAELEAAWKRVDEIVDKKRESLPFKQILTSKDGLYTFVLAIPSVNFWNLDEGRSLLAKIKTLIESLNPSAHGVEVRTAGNLDLLQEQHDTMSRDLRYASIIALVAGVLIVTTFTRRLSAPFIIGVPLVVGVLCTFALARIFVGHLNMVTGLLVAVLIGLGIDFGVHLFVRFQQELRVEGCSRADAVVRAVSGTFPPALTSALTTAGTFVSFVIADFRGFSEFGLIAGIGVLMTMIANFSILPPLLIVMGRFKTQTTHSHPIDAGLKTINRRVAYIVVLTIGSVAAFGAWHIGDINFRNNFRLLRGNSPATEFLDYVDQNLGLGCNPTVILTGSINKAKKTAEIAREQKEHGLPDGASRIGTVFSIADLLPKNPDMARDRIERLRKILADPKLDRAEEKGGKRAEQLAMARKMVRTEPWSVPELPETIRRRMTTLDNKEYIVFVWPRERHDADYQAAAWEDELAQLSKKLNASGITHSKADETVMVAWIYRLILKDGSPLLIMASIVVFIFLLLDFRNFKHTVLVAFPLSVGMMVFVGTIHVWGMDLNMFNLIVVPSVIGIGIDNAVHIYHRYRDQGPGSIVFVVRTTGMAALLASLTTGIGFGSSLISNHIGLKSLGILAIMGISSTFVAATVFFPCLLVLMEKRRKESK
ncbi:MAG: MMPL family transporter [Proteobacteria bacterium]|nr:MMPL family transporter [Pseudomonadota bacterium]